MDALVAIAMLCQVGAGNYNLSYADSRQLRCQKELIQCYSKKLETTEITPKSSSEDEALRLWKGPLKDCVLARKVTY